MKRNMMIGAVVVTALSMVSLSQAAVYTWDSSVAGGDDDWNNTVNWGGTVPGTLSRLDQIHFTGGVGPTVNVPTVDQQNTPWVNVNGNRTVTLQGSTGKRDGWGFQPTADAIGNAAVQLSNGATLIVNAATDAGDLEGLNREVEGTVGFNVNNSTLTFNAGNQRVDLAWSATRNSTVTLDNGAFNILGVGSFGMFGARTTGDATATDRSQFTLDNGSSFVTDGTFRGNMVDAGGDAYSNFDIRDTGSSVTFKVGQYYLSETDVSDEFGSVFTSPLGDGNLRVAQVGSDFVVTVIPEPATLGLVAAFGGGILFMRRRFMI